VLPVLDVDGVVGGVVVVDDVLSVDVVVIAVVSAGCSSAFAHAASASARARENATDGRMTFISGFPLGVYARFDFPMMLLVVKRSAQVQAPYARAGKPARSLMRPGGRGL